MGKEGEREKEVPYYLWGLYLSGLTSSPADPRDSERFLS